MIIPFIGVFISLTIWGTFLPVPGITTPNDPLVKRISTAMEITTMAKGIHDLAEIATASARGSYKPKYHPLPDPEPPIDIITPPDTITITTTTALPTPQTKALSIPQTKALTIYIPLRDPPHPDASKVCIPPPGFFVPYRYRSMTPCFVCSLLTLAKVATIVWFVCELVLLMGGMAWAVGRDVYEAFAQGSETGQQPRAVVDSPTALYDEIDALVGGSESAVPDGDVEDEDVCCFPFQGAGAGAVATQMTIDMYPHCETHTETETKTKTTASFSTPGHQRAPVSPAAGEGTAPDGSADEVRSEDDADLDAAAAWAPPYAPVRHWALVVRRLENVSPFFREFFREIFDVGQLPLPLPPSLPSPSQSSLPSLPPSPPPQHQHQHQQEKQQQQQQQSSENTIQGTAADTTGEKPKRKRKRPSQAKRRRYARRRQREQQEGNEAERENGVDSS